MFRETSRSARRPFHWKPPLLALGILLVSGSAIARQEPPPRSTAPSNASTSQTKKLAAALEGTWSITETSVPRAGAAAGSPHTGTETWRTATGGLTLTEENVTTLPGGDAHDTAFLWWDAKAQRLRGVWCADFNAEGCSGFTASWDGGRVLMVGEWEDDGGRHAWKEEFDFAGPDTFTQTLFVGPPGGELGRVSVIRATRVRSAPGTR